MIGTKAAAGNEKVEPFYKSFDHVVDAAYIGFCRLRKTSDIGCERRLRYMQRIVGTEGRHHFRRNLSDRRKARCDCFVILERIGGIVGRTHGIYIEFIKNIFYRNRSVGKQRIRLFPNDGRRRAGKRFGNIEITLQLQMRPMVQRIADEVFNRFRPF